MGGMGMPGGGRTGGGGNGIMLGKFTSSTTRGSLPWSNRQRSPRTQKPFSERGREIKSTMFSILQFLLGMH